MGKGHIALIDHRSMKRLAVEMQFDMRVGGQRQQRQPFRIAGFAQAEARKVVGVDRRGGDVERVTAVVAFPGMDRVDAVDGLDAERRHLRIAAVADGHGSGSLSLDRAGRCRTGANEPWTLVDRSPPTPATCAGAALKARLCGAAMRQIKPTAVANWC